jgi:hyaluronan synthase/N-acetylglucosaminyltransferase
MDMFSLYGLFAFTHLGLQMAFSHIEHRRQKKQIPIEFYPPVGVIIPVYNEDVAVLEKCINAVLDSEYPGKLSAVVVDDGSTNNCKELYIANNPRIKIIRTTNLGKREAQKKALSHLTNSEIIITIDSDTTISKNGIENLIAPFIDPEIGAVTGNIQVINEKQNLLTRLIATRYWSAFNQERAAQSLFGVVFCCSGPFSAYRSNILNEVIEKYTSQKFLGVPCTFGDDRHLTNLILEKKYKVKYVENAIAYTVVPHNINQYRKQQIRWSKSFIRELFWTAPNLRRHNLYLSYDFLMQLLLPFFLIIAIVHVINQTIKSPVAIIIYIAIVVLLATLRAVYGIARTKNPAFLIFGVYGFIYVFFLIPIKFYAIATIRNNGWGTR